MLIQSSNELFVDNTRLDSYCFGSLVNRYFVVVAKVDDDALQSNR